jgi:hypothetical protein
MVYTQPPWRGAGKGSSPTAGGAAVTAATNRDSPPMPVFGRVGPLSSGLSTRTLPAASFEEVRRACDHYERKCSGRYSDNVAAARHLKNLADEVRALLGPLEQSYMQATARPTRVVSNVSTLGVSMMPVSLLI